MGSATTGPGHHAHEPVLDLPDGAGPDGRDRRDQRCRLRRDVVELPDRERDLPPSGNLLGPLSRNPRQRHADATRAEPTRVESSMSVLAQVAAAAQEFQIVHPLASEPSVCPVMYLEVASHATALTDSAGSPPDFPTEPLPMPGSPVLPVEARPPLPLPIRKRSRFSQTATPEPDAKPHRQHIHGVQIGDRSSILDVIMSSAARPGARDRSAVACRAERQRGPCVAPGSGQRPLGVTR